MLFNDSFFEHSFFLNLQYRNIASWFCYPMLSNNWHDAQKVIDRKGFQTDHV